MPYDNRNRDLTPDPGTDENGKEKPENNQEGVEPKVDPTPAPGDPKNNPPEPPKEPVEPPAPGEDYKTKFSESSREAQRLAGENKHLNDRINSLTNIEVTDEDVRKVYPNFDDMDDIQKQLARDNVKNANISRKILLENQEKDEREKRESDLRLVYSQYPELAKKKEDFEAYIDKPNHKNTPITVLASSFMYDFRAEINDGKEPKQPETPAQGLENGSSGNFAPPVPGKPQRTDEEIKNLRENNPKEYNELVKKGEI